MKVKLSMYEFFMPIIATLFLFLHHVQIVSFLDSAATVKTFFTLPQFTWSPASHTQYIDIKNNYFSVVTGCQHSPQGLGPRATAAANSRLRQDRTARKFMLISFRSRTRRTCERSGLREWHTPPYIPAQSWSRSCHVVQPCLHFFWLPQWKIPNN